MSTGLRNPSNPRLGCDFSGVVESTGNDVTLFKEGNEVYADLMYQKKAYGAFAEYVCVPEPRLRMKPTSMSFDEAATIPQAGVLAVQGIKGKPPPETGQQVLINGAGGGVGTFAIQLAKYFGAEVTAVDNGDKLGFMRDVGADHTIDYTKEDYSKGKSKYDLILDVIAKRSVRVYRRALKSGGKYRMVGGSLGQIAQVGFGMLVSKFSSKKVGIMLGAPNKKEDMEFLSELYKAKKVVPVIDRRYSLEEVPQALEYLGTGYAKGKLVINMD